jgi:hypothetical protein
MPHSVRTGETAFDQHFGQSYFEYLAQHPEADRVFNQAMTGWTTNVADSVIAANGILFDQPHVAAAAKGHLVAAGVADRCKTIGGDFFVEVPSGEDMYLLAQILHDWDDERSTGILRQCRRAMPAHGKLLIVELVLPPGEEPFFGKRLDLHMLVLLGARERTAEEYKALLASAGFELARVIPTRGPSIVEAVPSNGMIQNS